MRRGGTIAMLCAGWACAVFLAMPLRAQVPHIPQALRDSLAHPPQAEGREAMRFKRMRIETGEIREEATPPSFTYRWTNAGERPLVITRVETTCGCAAASYDRRPVLPGGEGSITITYHPKRHPGYFRRRIFVFTQLSEKLPTAILELTGRVIPAALPTADYPYAMNALRLKQQEVHIAGDRAQTERIECLNAGEEPLRITADSLLLPPYIRFECDPQRLEPGATGDLVIRFDPSKAPERLPEQLPVILQGVGLTPRQSTVRIRFGTSR